MASQSPPLSPTPGKHCYMLPFPGGMRRKLRRWRHFSANSVRLFKYWGFWKVFDIKSFSVKHKSQVFPPFTYGVAVLRIDQSMSGTGFNPASHTCVASVVSCLWLLFRNERLCLYHRSLKSTVLPTYFFSSPPPLIVAWYMTSFWWQLSLMGHLCLFLRWQLQPFFCSSACPSPLTILLLCPLIICCMFLVHEYDTLMVFLLKMQWRTWFFGKCLDTSFRNSAPMFVATARLNGGLNQMISRFFLGLLLVGSAVRS